ncbi:MAG: ABC-type transport auxiliary lipoprotein family protein, partial [Smithellaceae bacterium]
THRRRTTVTEPTQGDDYSALVAAHSRALGRLSADIAKMIREIEEQKH